MNRERERAELTPRAADTAALAALFARLEFKTWLRELAGDQVEALVADIPAGHLGDPGDFGACAAFLCSDQASYVTGQTIEINGGWRG